MVNLLWEKNPQLDANIIPLWEDGYSITLIAERTSAATGIAVTRDSVSGRLKRLGLLGIERPKRARSGAITVPRSSPRQKRAVEAIPEPDPATVVPFKSTQPGQCRWMVNDHDCCGGACRSDSESWCAYHYEIVFAKRSAA